MNEVLTGTEYAATGGVRVVKGEDTVENLLANKLRSLTRSRRYRYYGLRRCNSQQFAVCIFRRYSLGLEGLMPRHRLRNGTLDTQDGPPVEHQGGLVAAQFKVTSFVEVIRVRRGPPRTRAPAP